MINQIQIFLARVLFVSVLLITIFKPANGLGQIKKTNHLREGLPPPQRSKIVSTIQDSLTLKQCIKIALENNPKIVYRSWEIKEANAQRNTAAGQRWPCFRGVGSYSRYTDTQRLAPPRIPDYPLIFADNVLSWNLVISMPIFTGGRITNEIRAFELLQQSAEHRLVFTRQELVFNVTSVFFTILKQRQIVKSLDFSRSTLKKHLQMVKELIAAKKAAKLDMLRIEVRLANINQKMEQEKSILAIQNRFLANLMGVKEIDFIVFPQSELSFAEIRIDLEECLHKAYLNRADYRAAQKEVEAQAKRVKATRAAHWPSLSLYGSYGAKKAIGSYIKPPGVNGLEDIGQVGCIFEIPFFEGGKIRAHVNQEEAKLASLKERLRELDLKIRFDVESAIYNLISTSKRIVATEKAIEQANESLRIEMEKYNLGKGSITDIFDAESALLEVQTSHTIALADHNIYIAHLRFAQGEAHEAN